MKNILRHSSGEIVFKGFLLMTFCTLAACRSVPISETVTSSSSPQLSPLPALPVDNATHYRVNADQTDMRILVYRGGPLARLGHNHVIGVREVEGDIYIARDFKQSGFEVRFPVAAMEVDPPAARAEEGDDFATVPSAQAIAGTRDNMLGSALLDAGNYPEITIRSVSISGAEQNPDVTVQITLHGVTREYTVPVVLTYQDHGLTANGMLALRTTDFEIEPFSILGGGLQVQDEIKVRFSIVADKA